MACVLFRFSKYLTKSIIYVCMYSHIYIALMCDYILSMDFSTSILITGALY